jgi:hypothetical protein
LERSSALGKPVVSKQTSNDMHALAENRSEWVASTTISATVPRLRKLTGSGAFAAPHLLDCGTARLILAVKAAFAGTR